MRRLLEAVSSSQFAERLAAILTEVLPRGGGRNKEQTERHCIANFFALLPVERLRFPLTLEHRDRPDCVLQFVGESVGIEITEAVSENAARSSVLRASGVGSSVYFPPRAVPGERVKTMDELRRDIEMDEAGPPWMGDEPEQDWSKVMLHFACKKLERASRPGFSRHDKNWLLIYDNWNLPAVDYWEAGRMLGLAAKGVGILEQFDALFVLGSSRLCEIAGPSVFLHTSEQ